MIKVLSIVAGALLVGIFQASPVFAAPAAPSPSSSMPMSFCDVFTPRISVSRVQSKPVMDHSLGTRPVNFDESPLGDNVGHQSGKAILTPSMVYNLASEGGETCVYIEELSVVVRMDTTVRIPNVYETDSCEDVQIGQHEERHMAATKDFVNQTVPYVKGSLQRDMKGLGGTSMLGRQDEDEARLYLKQVVEKKLAEYSRYLNDEYRKLHQDVIDSPAEMKKVYAACPGGWQPPPNDDSGLE